MTPNHLKQSKTEQAHQRFNLSAPFIQRPIATSLLTLALILLGILAFFKLPIASLPQAEYPTLRVNASLTGASPETMASAVATPLENAFTGVPGIREMSSTSSMGSTSITLQFQLDRPISQAIQDVQAAINSTQRQLPAAMTNPPTWRKVNPADAPVLILNVRSPDMSLTALSQLTENTLSRQLSQIDGVAEVNIYGQRRPAITLAADPVKLAAYRLTLADVRSAIQQASVNQPTGTLYGRSITSNLDTNGQLTTPEEFGQVIVRNESGRILRVADVATVTVGTESPYVYAEQNGEQGLNVSVSRQPDANVVDTVDRVLAALPTLQQSLPASVTVSVLNDRTRTIRATLHEVEITLLITIALVLIVMGLFLRQLSATLIVGGVLIVSLIATFAGMWLLGFSLNNLSLMALIIAVGFIVDDAIVVVENIHRYLEQGYSAREAALRGTGEIGFTVISISLSLIAAFTPLIFMDGIIGRLFREFALTMTLAIELSIVTSLTLAPMLASRFMKTAPATHGGISGWFERQYIRVLRPVLAHPWLTFSFFLATVGATVWLYLVIPKGFVPEQDTGFIQGSATAAETISYQDMVARSQALARIIGQDPAVAGYGFSVGSTGGNQSLSSGRFLINLKPVGEREVSARQWINQMRPKLAQVPGIQLSLRPAQDINLGVGSGSGSYQYLLTGPDLAELTKGARGVATALRQVPQITDVNNDQRLGAAVTALEIDRTQAARYGLTTTDINQALYLAYGRPVVGQYQTDSNLYSILLTLNQPNAAQDSLGMIQLRSPKTGGMVPLLSVARLLPPQSGPVQVVHQGLYPAVSISFSLAPNVALGEAVSAIDRQVATLTLPEGVQGIYSGNAQAFQDSLKSQPLLILAALIAVYIILGVLYESLRDPLIILSTLPSAGLGALLALWLSGMEFSIIALIGIILLIGIVKKNGILLVDFARSQREQGASAYDAIYQACQVRFRPILMTTIAALLGAVPLVVAFGEGAELRKPLGIAIVGGLLLSQVLTLLTTPVLYLLLEGGWRKPPLRPAVASAEKAMPQ